MSERDFIYGGFYQNMPGNIPYGNVNFNSMPGNLFPFDGQQNINNGNALLDIANKINNLENKIKILEDKIKTTSSNIYPDDDSLYMI